MGMGKIKALKIRSIGFFAPDFLHVAFLGFSAKKRLRQKLKVMSEILSVPASRNNFAKKDRIDYSCGGAACFWCCVICPEDADLAFIPAEVRLAITIKRAHCKGFAGDGKGLDRGSGGVWNGY